MSKIKPEENTVLLQDKGVSAASAAYKLCAPAVMGGVVIIALSYIFDYLYVGAHTSTLGEGSAVSSVMFNAGNLILNCAFILVAVAIAVKKGGLQTLVPSVIGSVITLKGSTLGSIEGSVAGVSGLFGFVLAGLTAGYSIRLCKHITKKNDGTAIVLTSTVIATASAVLISSVSVYINSGAMQILSVFAESKTILLPITLGIFISIDGGGPLYLCAYVFGVASIAANEPKVMAAVLGAGMVPALALGLFAYIYNERMDRDEIYCAYTGIVPALLGLPQGVYPLYVSKGLRIIIPCTAGSVITSVLSMLLRCSTEAPVGGLLTISSTGNPLYLLLAVIFGTLVTTALMSLTVKERKVSDISEDADNKASVPKGAKA